MKFTDGFHREPLYIREMMICMIKQDLCEFPWAITLQEYLELIKIRYKDE